MESSQSQQQRRGGGLILQTPPRSSDKAAARDLRSGEGNNNMSGKHDKEKGVNVQVILRCRPLSEDEIRLHTPVVISCNEGRREVSAIQNIANKQIDRTFAFDKVFGPTSQQKDLYDSAIWPIVFEVLEGYNCTIFAYGQTGTGKTYTMEGGGRKKNGEFPSDAGVIPRAVRQIFEILEAQNAEYSMKVTFLELYNEEITDLLAPEECTKYVDDKSKKPIALMEDGKGGVLVRGLEEEIVSTANEIYKILEKGSAKRRTAETLLNKQSSRSHSIFSITIHIKECTPEGEEMIKCGKLNLVDLAGSENISRSGAREGRAREAGEINKSLLTLGRVINALVEHSGHIPYRDSKLTRLLRDSLGGKTKTCIIATISPSVHCLEETLSTLDYAHRAKNIKNKPEINQKMMKSAMIKDLYSEIDRLKQGLYFYLPLFLYINIYLALINYLITYFVCSILMPTEVYAAREKNGIYIPRDRYLQEEAEKKAMSEKIERMELDFESRDKKLLELQELYNSQQLLTAELGDKLEKTEKKLQETQHTLADLEEKHRQAITTIKEKEFLISNLLKSEKALVEQAFELRAELENAASDVSNLFAKIERKDKIEDGNKVLIQKFQSQLTQELEVLHKTVASSTTQQEQQLKGMEEDMQSFVSTKTEAVEELRSRLENLKTMFGSGIKALDGLAGELDGNAQSTFDRLNCEVSKHSSALGELFKEIASEADILVNDLQKSLHNQEEKLIAFSQQQREAHCGSITMSRSISQITGNFFKTLDMHVSQLGEIVEEAQTVSDQKFSELENKFEECAANEERQILEKVAELLAGSNARKKKLVQTAIDDLRESASNKTNRLKQEMSTMQDSTSSVKVEWSNYMEKAESHYLEDTAAVENGKKEMEEVLQNCVEKAKLGAKQWTNAQQSLLNLEERNVAFVDEIVRGGMDANQALRMRFSSGVSSTLEDTDAASKHLLSSIDHSLQLDRDACANLDSTIVPCCGELRELNSGHYHKVVEITEYTGKCLSQEYVVDEPSCSTPTKRPFNLPSVESIEELKTPAFEELLNSFWDGKSSKQANGDVKHIAEVAPLRDSRVALTALN
ncbi:kinesin-like protein KIN-5D isoform X1 [Nicotiana sylvestris]|uniref:125 kDa kinesin-related protein-like isoform X1 n=1 Tax=Nicotiana sylvestris TaxID=4096 RepID=A0A1U7XP41_NICSY|nr:PREDICTED: 125 kDa kinesin-related protein-like isoform X1 [Nicotiana sylvestris]XP_009792665.1 PREDICTED: 125 kDa kinesin-related protein-like isoform X1 [Nicotiana sylvestris]XP_009792668.1 PREDICTED: 125 kDa kinesin-related protein-like isoform X1 [Nicotiana sylvestris]XP_009792674.1 PREDICTED: 125 kDa kinesin-related protein-like isoform X1 [Nicotiana sylvestris]XP_009792682.1 PREDICTED: 125 kDa kinesin-related protein-like isoform X1 [Nicotiana sylvestris]XP_009792689.1 PREDICTED: 125 